ncbi:hypothetical protein PRIPAC_93897 [Pristionchus pacificus]|uniref:Uncharacterized protein n=1 Tax=Pristionchus pacificus TaxID=54126 RepID=A0A2A6C9P7_PRIPA|nr:hypothetical protein PRIPAC_93897 [Pristionchus pacificus]|eukprot:PDM74783.1 hypothetical protein PRIPAC_43734 [Pristionchus pacificus]
MLFLIVGDKAPLQAKRETKTKPEQILGSGRASICLRGPASDRPPATGDRLAHRPSVGHANDPCTAGHALYYYYCTRLLEAGRKTSGERDILQCNHSKYTLKNNTESRSKPNVAY